jgi:hypothetical protein
MQLKSNRFTSSCSLLHRVRVQRELYSVKRSSTRFTALEFAHILVWRGLLGTCRGRFAATQARCSAKNRLPYLRKTNNWARISAADGLRCLPTVTRRGSYGRDLLEIRPVKKKSRSYKICWKFGRRSDLAFTETKKGDRRERIVHTLFPVRKLFNNGPMMSEPALSNFTRIIIHSTALQTQLRRW